MKFKKIIRKNFRKLKLKKNEILEKLFGNFLGNCNFRKF